MVRISSPSSTRTGTSLSPSFLCSAFRTGPGTGSALTPPVSPTFVPAAAAREGGQASPHGQTNNPAPCHFAEGVSLIPLGQTASGHGPRYGWHPRGH